MVHVVVIGAGIGGMPMAYELREALRSEDTVTVIGNGPDFQFTPSNPWVLVGWRKRKDVTVPVETFLKKKNIDFIPVPAQKLVPGKTGSSWPTGARSTMTMRSSHRDRISPSTRSRAWGRMGASPSRSAMWIMR